MGAQTVSTSCGMLSKTKEGVRMLKNDEIAFGIIQVEALCR